MSTVELRQRWLGAEAWSLAFQRRATVVARAGRGAGTWVGVDRSGLSRAGWVRCRRCDRAREHPPHRRGVHSSTSRRTAARVDLRLRHPRRHDRTFSTLRSWQDRTYRPGLIMTREMRGTAVIVLQMLNSAGSGLEGSFSVGVAAGGSGADDSAPTERSVTDLR
jgi:hypothetical protein